MMPIRPRRSRQSISRVLESLEPRQFLHGDVNLFFNFQPAGAPVPSGTIADFGNAYGNRGNGYAYGWNADNTANARDRDMVSNQALDTVAFMQNGPTRSWELEIANGDYEITIGSGDARYRDGVHDIYAENTRVMYGIQSRRKQFLKATKTVTVADGKLSLHVGPEAIGAKINYLAIKSVHAAPDALPTVTLSATDDSATEGADSGTIRVSRTSEHLDQVLTVQLAWSGSAGKHDKDIVSLPTSVSFPANTSFVDLSIVPIDDSLDEALETAKATLVANSGAYVVGSQASASVFIVGAEAPPDPVKPTITVATITSPVSEAGGVGQIRITRDANGLSDPLTVLWTWSGSASGADVNREQTSITLSAGVSSVVIPVQAIDDSIDEADETATLTLSTSGAYTVGSPASASVVIQDDDEAPTLSNITWSATSAPPISYSETTSLTLNGKIYLFGGFNGAFVPQKDVYSFNGTSWTTHANSPKAFTHTGHAQISSIVAWFAGGYIGNGSGQIFGTTEVFTYDAATDTWGNAPALPAARAGGNLVKVGRSVYFFGGENLNRTADMTTTWALDLDNQGAGWVTKASMPMSRNHASALEVDGKIYVLAGQTGFDNGLTAHDDIQIYNPANNTWAVSTQKLPAVRSHTSQSVFYHHGRILLVTGESDHNVPVNTVWSIDPTTLATTAFNNFPDARFSVACAILNDKLYAFGGYKGSIATTSYVGTFVLS